MALNLDDIVFLRSERGSQCLDEYAACAVSESDTLRLLTHLRKSLSLTEASAVLTTLRLRKRAVAKFPRHARDMLFTEAGLQQASHPLVRRYRALQVESQDLLDICCGIGGDSLAFAAAGKQVLGLDIDPVRIAIARHNAAATLLSARFEVADADASRYREGVAAYSLIRGAATGRAGESIMSSATNRRFRWHARGRRTKSLLSSRPQSTFGKSQPTEARSNSSRPRVS